ncbi:MAG: carboxymuconolactone decarboxylase family protein [Actinomycetia bacterium]|nr:carboxymuconolactone decarboxylase family protein [Actinomycetes bacterium]MCH9699865.1 carboxymuconolactone decarboxylase family protein [Actinomycetes bacterium]MCH9761918.1 carboxymuconolactone decarboxylase family protein [Actinomycetes bacterium]
MKLAAQDSVTGIDGEFGQMAVEVGRHAWGLPQLSMREKAFIFIAADLHAHLLGFPLESHVAMARSHGVPMAAMREAVRHLAPYVGYPCSFEALMRLKEIASGDDDHATDASATEDNAGSGEEPARLDPGALAAMRGLDPDFADFFANQFAQRWNRPGLSVRERALATIATDVLGGSLEDSFRLHVELARAHGSDDDAIRAVLLLVAEFGVSKAWRAYAALQRL